MGNTNWISLVFILLQGEEEVQGWEEDLGGLGSESDQVYFMKFPSNQEKKEENGKERIQES